MITMVPVTSLANARKYFRENLQVGDYYAENHSIEGEWFGKGAEKLGLKGAVNEKTFLSLVEGNDPNTGQFLTQRKNRNRMANGEKKSNRRIYHDLVLSPPKSVSIVALNKDSRIVDLHNESVKKAMTELEKWARTRVRKNGRNTDRITGNVVGAMFRHDTSRELDPHLHTHCILFNATYDPVEERWKALETKEMFQAKKFTENYYYHELSKGLKRMFYGIENNAGSFEISGVPKELITTFSKRHQQIDEETQRRIETERLASVS